MNRLTLLAAAVLAAGSLAAKSPEYRRVEARENAQKPEWKSYEAKTVDRLPGFNCRKSDPKQSVYGGWMVDRQEATGFFRTQKIGDRWWLIDPEGWPFIHKAVAVFTTAVRTARKRPSKRNSGRAPHGPPTSRRCCAATGSTAGSLVGREHGPRVGAPDALHRDRKSDGHVPRAAPQALRRQVQAGRMAGLPLRPGRWSSTPGSTR